MSEQLPRLEPTTPPPARRLNRLALGLGLSLGALVFVAGALVLTSQRPAPEGPATGPKAERSAEAGFLNQPPRPRSEVDPIEENARIAALLRKAQPSSSGPFSFGPSSQAQGLVPPDTLPDGGETVPPPGVYRPFSSYNRVTLSPPDAGPGSKPSWQAAFASSLVPSSSGSAALAGSQSVPGLPNSYAPPTAPLEPAAREQASASPVASLRPPAGSRESAPSIAKPTRGLVRASSSHSLRRTLRAGTVINGILLTSISSEMPGDVSAHLTGNTYAADGSILLPKGTRLVGSYQNRVSLGKRRLAVAWDRLIVAGRSYDLAGLPSTSPDGATGLPGSVNHHTALVFGRAALLSVISAGAQLGQPRRSRTGATLTDREILAGSVSDELSQAAADLLNRAVDVEPTIHIPSGTRVTVFLPYDLELPLH